MKYDKKEPETMDADPMRLLVSAILAFTVMLFINGFVGSMGGFPAFVAFTLVFFRIRTRAGMENGGMQQELADRQITGRLLWKYAAGYLVLWGILRIAFLISRVTGWGNINGASAVEYVRQMWNTSLLEKWAYFFAGMIMFAFVLSLFPLAVIREKVRWIRYALVDGAVFALVCLGINGEFCHQWKYTQGYYRYHRIRSVCHIHPRAGHILLFRQARYPVYKRTAW